MLQLGLESGSDRVLAEMNKGITSAEASCALRCLHDAGIATYVYLLFGTPWETEREAQLTMDFTEKHAPLIDFLNIAVFNMPAVQDAILRMLFASFPTLICRCILILCIPQAGIEKPCVLFWLSALNDTKRLPRSSG